MIPVTRAAALLAAASLAAGYLARCELERRRRAHRKPRPGLAVALGPDAWVLGRIGAVKGRMDPGDRVEGIAVSVVTADGEYAGYTASEHQGPHKRVHTPVATGYGTVDVAVVMPPVPNDASGLEGA
jgi:hypothetical protein